MYKLLKVLETLIDTNSSIKDDVIKKKSRLLSLFLLSSIIILIVTFITHIKYNCLKALVNILSGIILLTIAYIINKMGKYLYSALIFVLSFPIAQFIYLTMNKNFNTEINIVIPILGVFLTGLFLSLREIIIVAIIYLINIAILPVAQPLIYTEKITIIRPFLIFLFSFVITIVASIHNSIVEAFRTKQLKESEERYRILFEETPVATWNFDGSELKTYIDKLKEKGIYDFQTFFTKHPEEIYKCHQMIKLINCNHQLLQLYHFKNFQDAKNQLKTYLQGKNLENFKEILLNLANGKLAFQFEETHTIMDNKKLIVFKKLLIPSVFKDNWKQILITVTDITHTRDMEYRLLQRAHFHELVARVGNLINSSLDLDKLLKTTVSSISSMLGYYNNSIWFYDGNFLHLKAYSFSNIKDLQQPIAKLANEKLPVEGIIGWAIKDREIKYVPDVFKNKYYVKHGIELKTKSECAIPLRFKGKIVGVLDIQDDKPDAFTDEDIHILSIVADQISVALQNANLYEETKKHAEKLSALNSISNAINSTLDLDEILKKLYGMIKKMIPCDSFYIAIYNDKNKTVDYRLIKEWGKKIKPFTINLDKAYASTRYVIEKNALLNLDNLAEYRKKNLEKKYWGTGKPPKALIALPLKVKKRIIGVLSLQSYSKNLYTRTDEEFLQTLSEQLAIAMENASLFKQLEDELRERKELQNQLVQAQKMEAIGTLSGGIAHDFNNILTAIIGYTDLLLSEPTEQRIIDNLLEIKSASKRATALTNQLLAFSRKQMLSIEVLDLNNVINDLEKMLRRLIMENIDLKIITSNEPCLVKSDRSQLNQIIMNLVVNARDAMPDGGKLTIETQRVRLTDKLVKKHLEFIPGDYIMLAISDSGIGMDSSTIKHIFEPFFTTKEVGRGTGLGLSMVYGIVKQTNGDISVYSEPGKGTTFKIYFPEAESTSLKKGSGKTKPGKSLNKNLKILLVEDESFVRDVTKRILTHAHFSVIDTGSTREAIEIFRSKQGNIDLLITDVIMPGSLNGLQLAEKLKEILQTLPDKTKENLKVLYISGYTENSISHHGILEPGIFFLQKPFSPEELLSKITEVIDKGGIV